MARTERFVYPILASYSYCFCSFLLLLWPNTVHTAGVGGGSGGWAERSHLPTFKVTYGVTFSSLHNDTVPKWCGRYYAEVFLRRFVAVEDVLKDVCASTSGASGVTLEIQPIVTIFLHVNLFQLDTYVQYRWTQFPVESVALLRCASLVNDTINDGVTFGRLLNDIGVGHIPAGDSNSSHACVSVNLVPESFFAKANSWECKPGFVLDPATWRCQIAPVTAEPFTGKSTPSLVNNEDEDISMPTREPWKLQILNSTSHLELDEGGPEVLLMYELQVSHEAVCVGRQRCQLMIDVEVADVTDRTPAKCLISGKQLPQLVIKQSLQHHPSSNHLQNYQTPGGSTCSFSGPLIRSNTSTVQGEVVMRAVQDGIYDGPRLLSVTLSLKLLLDTQEVAVRTVFRRLAMVIRDRDQKATCKSINDPHITTFDGLEYNNYLEGEFVLYQHKELPFEIHVVYQKCDKTIAASCNCAVGIRSGNDVFVIDRCFRHTRPFKRLQGLTEDTTFMKAHLYLNGDLTPATRIYRKDDGMKYIVYLPNGVIVKVMVSSMQLNVWVMAPPGDWGLTRGLCGTYDNNKVNDLSLRDGRTVDEEQVANGRRGEPRNFCLHWRVDIDGPESIMEGVPANSEDYTPPIYCDCSSRRTSDAHNCGYAANIQHCDYEGEDITSMLVSMATVRGAARGRRSVQPAAAAAVPIPIVSVTDDEPVQLDTDFRPPVYNWKSGWSEMKARGYCDDHLTRKYPLGKMCEQLDGVDVRQDVDSCVEDIKITGNTTWANSARDALKEQCLEVLHRNANLPKDMAQKLASLICINDCSQHGTCVKGSCQCDQPYSGADCSVLLSQPPYAGKLPQYGLCDVRTMSCSSVIVYGKTFVPSNNLTCHLQECEVTKTGYTELQVPVVRLRALFINFNAVECMIPQPRCYSISISNDGAHPSDPLLFVPFDSVCNACNTNDTRCIKRKNSCIIDDRCYAEGDKSPVNECLVCLPHSQELQWTTLADGACAPNWWKTVAIPDWFAALAAAVGGSFVGIVVGILAYQFCCKRKKAQREFSGHPTDDTESSPYDDTVLHRNHGLPVFTSDPICAFNVQRSRYFDTNTNDDQRDGNIIDASTYF